MKHRPQIVAFMTPFPYSIDIDAPLSEARAFMRRRRIRHLPVTSQGTVVGLITDRDIKLLLGPDFAYPAEKELVVRDVCVEDPYIVPASTPVAVVARWRSDISALQSSRRRRSSRASLHPQTLAEHLRSSSAPPTQAGPARDD
jgi:CBS domain-containing protein